MAEAVRPAQTVPGGWDAMGWTPGLVGRLRTHGDPAGVRAAFVNSGMLGHRTVADLLRECVDGLGEVAAVHIDLSRDLSLIDRGVRRLLSVRVAPTGGYLGNLDLRRWRQELNVGLLAARRLAGLEALHGAFDLLHFHTQAAAYASLARMRRTPTIVSIDATQSLARMEASSALSRLTYGPNIAHDGLVFRAATAITATSEWAARDLARQYPDCADKVHVMPYPIRPLGDESWIAARAARAGQVKPRALFVGGDFPRKGGLDLLDVWRRARLHEVATLDLVSDWPIPDDLPPGVRRLTGVTAYTPEWRALWRDADFFVMPTRHEAFGMVFQEAAAAGLPVIATRLNAIPEIVRDGVTGTLVRAGDGDDLARAIRVLAGSSDLRRQMGAEALAAIRTQGSVARYADRLQGLIHTALLERGLHHV